MAFGASFRRDLMIKTRQKGGAIKVTVRHRPSGTTATARDRPGPGHVPSRSAVEARAIRILRDKLPIETEAS